MQAAALADAVAQCLRALAQMMPVLVFAGFGRLLMQSSLSVALAAALKQSDVFVTGAFAAAGWLLSSYLGHVEKRFDGVDEQLTELTELLTQRNSGSC